MADLNDLRLAVFTSKTCGTCAWLKSSGVLEKFAEKYPAIEITRVDGDTPKGSKWADDLGIRGWPFLAMTKKGETKARAAIANPASMKAPNLDALVKKAIENIDAGKTL